LIVVAISVVTSEGLNLVRKCKCGLLSQSYSICHRRSDKATWDWQKCL